MPNRPIDFTFTSDVVALLNGLGKAELSVEDLEQAFVEASNSSSDLERKINRATREAEKDVEKLERAVRDIPKATDDAADAAGRDFERMGDDAQHSFDRVPDSARDVGRDTGQSFRQSLGESMSSGRGDLGESLSETLGEAIGEAPLPIAAIGLLALQVWNHFKAESEKRKKEMAEAFDLVDLITGEIDKVKQMEEALTDLGVGNLQDGLETAGVFARAIGISMGDATAVIMGQTDPATQRVRDNLQAMVDETVKAGEAGRVFTQEELEAVAAASRLLELGEENTAEIGRATDGAHLYQDAMLGAERKVVDLNRNLEGVVDTTDILALKAADTNLDGMVDSVEAAKAGLDDVLAKIGEVPTDVKIKVRADLTEYYAAMPGRGGSAYPSAPRAN